MNVARRRVILYGDSLILQGVRAELAGIPDLEVLMLDRPLDAPLEKLRAFHPTAIIFDLGAVQPNFPLALLREPGVLLIGMNPETHQAQVWSGKQAAAAGTANLIRLIQNPTFNQSKRRSK
jgi:hypothetical protein